MENPLTGTVITAVHRDADSSGDRLTFDLQIPPQEKPTMLVEFAHIDPRQQQRVAVIEGTIDAKIGADEASTPITVAPGEVVAVPPRTPHQFWNRSAEETTVRVTIWPALDFEGFLRFQYERAARVHGHETAVPEGDVIDNPVTGEKIRFIERAVDSDGEVLVIELFVPPHGRFLEFYSKGVIHPNQQKFVSVRSGVLLARTAGTGLLQTISQHDYLFYNPLLIKLKPVFTGARLAAESHRRATVPPLTVLEGDEIVVQPGTPHQLWNPTDRPTRLLVEFRPALRTEQLLETLYGLAWDGLVDTTGKPAHRTQWHVILQAFKNELRPPQSRTRSTVLSNLGNAVGKPQQFAPWYPEYSPNPDKSALAGVVSADRPHDI